MCVRGGLLPFYAGDLCLSSLCSQGVAVLGIALIAMGEEIGSEMALRTFGHLVSVTASCNFSILVLFLFPLIEYYCSNVPLSLIS